MIVKSICQAFLLYLKSYMGPMPPHARLALLLALLLAGPVGCLHQAELLERSLAGPMVESSSGPSPHGPSRPVNPLPVLACILGLGGVGLLLRRCRRGSRRAGQEDGEPSGLDREDLALLRTARDALTLLVQKQFRRLRVVWLEQPRPGRGH